MTATALAVGVNLSQASIASAAGGHDSLYPYIQGSDPSLGQTVGDTSRFSKEVSATGAIWVVEAHDPGNGHPYLKLLKTLDGRMYGLYGTEAAELEPGKRYEVTGRLDPSPANFQAAASGDVLALKARELPSKRSERPWSPPLAEAGQAGFVLAFVSWPGSGPTSFDQDAPAGRGLSDWSSTASNGQFRWDPVEMVEIELAEPLASCKDSDSGPRETQIPSWVETVRAALEAEGFDLKQDFRALGIALPEGFPTCGGGAYAFMGSFPKIGQCEWYGTEYYEPECGLSIYGYRNSWFPVLIHELGHTLSLPHASSMNCQRDGVPVVMSYTRGCRPIEYGDRFDPMGSSGAAGRTLYNPAFNDRLGWIEDTEADRLPLVEEAEREVTLSPYAGSSGVRMFQTELPLIRSEGRLRSPGKVYIEYRIRTGLDNSLYPDAGGFPYFCPQGVGEAVYVRVVPNAFGEYLLGIPGPGPDGERWWPESYVLDTNPETVFLPDLFGLCDAGLQPGDSWEDPTGKLKIDFLRRAADLSSATIEVRSAGAEEERPTLELEKVGEGNGKIVIEKTGFECEDRCTHRLQDDSEVTIRAVPDRGSVFRFWMGDCGGSGTNPSCWLDSEWGQTKVIRAGFDIDPNPPPPDIDFSAIRLTPASLKVKAGKRARFSVQVTNTGLDEGDARVSLSSSAPSKAKVPGSVSFKVPGESMATGSFTVTTRKMQKGRVTISAKVGPHMSRASLVLTR